MILSRAACGCTAFSNLGRVSLLEPGSSKPGSFRTWGVPAPSQQPPAQPAFPSCETVLHKGNGKLALAAARPVLFLQPGP